MSFGQASGNARAGRVRFLIGLVVILGAVSVLVARGAKNAAVYYIEVSELVAKPAGADLDGLRVRGTVVPGTIVQSEMELRFEMTDGSTNIPVTYRGVVPDTFKEEGEVVVEGTMASGAFQASFLMAKCPSKYEAEIEENSAQPA
jgi:cytochrome c-type biogenesis protein CcmE